MVAYYSMVLLGDNGSLGEAVGEQVCVLSLTEYLCPAHLQLKRLCLTSVTCLFSRLACFIIGHSLHLRSLFQREAQNDLSRRRYPFFNMSYRSRR